MAFGEKTLEIIRHLIERVNNMELVIHKLSGCEEHLLDRIAIIEHKLENKFELSSDKKLTEKDFK